MDILTAYVEFELVIQQYDDVELITNRNYVLNG